MKMKIAMIADDLTGANDSGVQLVRYGLRTTVVMNGMESIPDDSDVVIFDTDSRALPQQEAYRKVKEISTFLKKKSFDVIYKKIDSTMRGNIGAEINALYEVFQPDFVIIAPGFPTNGRQIIDGFHYLNGRLLHETEVGQDPKTPVKESYIPKLVMDQTQREVRLITHQQLSLGASIIKEQLRQWKQENISYLVFDSSNEQDLKDISTLFSGLHYSVLWVGSAGLAQYLPVMSGFRNEQNHLQLPKASSPVMLVAGSVSRVTRHQLDKVLTNPNVEAVEVNSSLLVMDRHSRQKECDRAYNEALDALGHHRHVALFSSGSPEDIKNARYFGLQAGLNSTEVSNMISCCLGEIAAGLIENCEISRVVLTGGDTARQVFNQFQATGLDLLDEVEPGIPVGRLNGKKELFVITKAGGFGSELSLSKAIKKLEGEAI